MAEKILSLSRVRADRTDLDTVAESKRGSNYSRRAFDVLFEAQRHWDAMARFRRNRERCKRYCYGDQWGDMVCVDGHWMTEETYIMKQGNIPLENNLIRRLVRNVIGVYRSQSKEPTCFARDRDEQRMGETMSTVLQYNMQTNRRTGLDARTFEEFLISGLAVHRKWHGWRNDRKECWTDYVQPNNFFIDVDMRDFRGWDCSIVGEVHDVSFASICSRFARNAADYDMLSNIYVNARRKGYLQQTFNEFGYSRTGNYDFMLSSDPCACRVIEVWRKETKPRYRCHDYNTGECYKVEIEDYESLVMAKNRERIERGLAQGMRQEDIPLIEAEWFIDDYWYYYFLTPFGHILDEGETPYEHKSHPYVWKAYPFIDGEIHSFVADVIDQQRYVNRLITMYDWIMRASAKGVLLIPEQVLEDSGMSIEDIADEWSKFNGVITYKAKAGIPLPQQIASNSVNIGINELLNLQLKFFEDISGVNGALQGKPGYSTMSGTLYAQQTQNATTSLLDILDAFGEFIVDGAYKDVKNIQQFYDEKRIIDIAGRSGRIAPKEPQRVLGLEFDISIDQSTSTPAYRQMANEFLMQIWQTGQITLEQLLENGNFPFADDLLQSIRSDSERMQGGEAMQGVPQGVVQQAQRGADMNAVNRAYGMLTAA